MVYRRPLALFPHLPIPQTTVIAGETAFKLGFPAPNSDLLLALNQFPTAKKRLPPPIPQTNDPRRN